MQLKRHDRLQYMRLRFTTNSTLTSSKHRLMLSMSSSIFELSYFFKLKHEISDQRYWDPTEGLEVKVHLACRCVAASQFTICLPLSRHPSSIHQHRPTETFCCKRRYQDIPTWTPCICKAKVFWFLVLRCVTINAYARLQLKLVANIRNK